MLKVLALGIYVIQYLVCVKFVTRSEHTYLVVLIHFLEHLMSLRPDVEVGLELFSRLQIYLKLHVRFLLRFLSSNTMSECLIKIKKEQLVDSKVLLLPWQNDFPLLDFLLVYFLHVLQEVDGLEDVNCELAYHIALELAVLITDVVLGHIIPCQITLLNSALPVLILLLPVLLLKVTQNDLLVRHGCRVSRDQIIDLILAVTLRVIEIHTVLLNYLVTLALLFLLVPIVVI